MITKQLALGDFDSFLKSKKIVIVRLYKKDTRAYRWELDNKVKSYFIAEYQPNIALGSLEIDEIFPFELWSKKHLAQFATKGEGYYLAHNGQLIAWHSEEVSNSIQLLASAIEGKNKGWAQFLSIVSDIQDVVASHQKPNLPESVARLIIELFESALNPIKK